MPRKINVAQLIAKNQAAETENNMAQMIERAQNLETGVTGLVQPRVDLNSGLEDFDEEINPPTSEEMLKLTRLATAYQDNNRTSKASIFMDVELKKVLDRLREASGGKIGAKFFLNAIVRCYIDDNKEFIKEYISNFRNNQHDSLLD